MNSARQMLSTPCDGDDRSPSRSATVSEIGDTRGVPRVDDCIRAYFDSLLLDVEIPSLERFGLASF